MTRVVERGQALMNPFMPVIGFLMLMALNGVLLSTLGFPEVAPMAFLVAAAILAGVQYALIVVIIRGSS